MLDFASLWAQPEHPFHTHIRNMWLEFDMAAVSPHPQVADVLGNPCLFWGPTLETPLSAPVLQLLLEAMSSLHQADVDDHLLRSLVASLPDQARLFQVGMMVSRDHPVVRGCVNRLASRDIAAWLAALHWPGDTAALTALLHTLSTMLRSVAVDLDFTTAGLAEKIGLECYMDWAIQEPQQWLPLLDYLTGVHLCVPSKQSGILAFPGTTGLLSFRQPAMPHGIIYPQLIRNIHHLKLNFMHGRIVEAKAYLGVYRPGIMVEHFLGEGAPDSWYVA